MAFIFVLKASECVWNNCSAGATISKLVYMHKINIYALGKQAPNGFSSFNYKFSNFPIYAMRRECTRMHKRTRIQRIFDLDENPNRDITCKSTKPQIDWLWCAFPDYAIIYPCPLIEWVALWVSDCVAVSVSVSVYLLCVDENQSQNQLIRTNRKSSIGMRFLNSKLLLYESRNWKSLIIILAHDFLFVRYLLR